MNAELEKYRKDIQVLRETAQQVRKDFESCGLEMEFTENETLPYEVLLDKVKQQLEKSVKMQAGAFQNLLYRIDIPERTYVQLKNSSGNFMHDLGKLILEREFMKVITRMFYGPGK